MARRDRAARTAGTAGPARRGRRGPLVQVPGGPGPDGVRRPEPALRGLRPGALRRHRDAVRGPHRGRPRRAAAASASRRARRRHPGASLPDDVKKIADLSRRRAVGDVRAAGLCAAGLCAAGLCAAGLCAAGLCAAGLCAAGLRARLLRTRPRFGPEVPRRLLGRPGPDAPGGLGQGAARRGEGHGRHRTTPPATSTSASRATTTRSSTSGHSYQLGLTVSGIQDCLGEDGAGLLDTARCRPRADRPRQGDGDPHRHRRAEPVRRPRPRGGRRCPTTSTWTRCETLAADTDGVVVDLHESDRVTDAAGTGGHVRQCPYATNLVADAIKDIVDTYRADGNTLKYVVLAGGDEVIPFFRYPDTSGLGPESQFELDMLADTPAGASLDQNQVLGQDAYGSRTERDHRRRDVPVPDLAVGRLVKTPEEIESTVAHFHQLEVERNGTTLPVSAEGEGRSLVTGYDFLADAAKRVNAEFADGPAGRRTRHAHRDGRRPRTTTPGTADRPPARAVRRTTTTWSTWPATSAPTTRWPPTSTRTTPSRPAELAPARERRHADRHPACSAPAATPATTSSSARQGRRRHGEDWSQQLARQQAAAHRRHRLPVRRLRLPRVQRAALPRASASGCAKARPTAMPARSRSARRWRWPSRTTWPRLSTLQGIDQKAVLQATLYGLPMTGFDAPGRQPIGGEAPSVRRQPSRQDQAADLACSPATSA